MAAPYGVRGFTAEYGQDVPGVVVGERSEEDAAGGRVRVLIVVDVTERTRSVSSPGSAPHLRSVAGISVHSPHLIEAQPRLATFYFLSILGESKELMPCAVALQAHRDLRP